MSVTLLRSFLVVTVFLAAACRPDYPKCKRDEHCAKQGEVCVEGICKECETDEQCKEGFTCKENACVALPQCRVDADCAEGMKCRGGQCVPQCSSDRDCASGEKCEAGRCKPVAECASDADCAEGSGCVEGRCVPKDTGATAPDDEEARRRAALANCTLERVPYEFNEFALSDGARAALDRNAECIRFRNRAVLIAGHADERGTEEYNLVLAEKRANAAKRYLVGLGVADGLLKTVSFGEEKPLDPGHTEDAWSTNRRAELSFR